MAKKIKIQVVRREPLDAEKLAQALAEIAIPVVKPPRPAETTPTQEGK